MKKFKILTITTIFLLILTLFSGCLSVNKRVPIEVIHFSKDGSMIVTLTEFLTTTSGESGHILQIWDTQTGSELFSKFHRYIFFAQDARIDFSPDNNYIILPNFVKDFVNKTCIFDWKKDMIVYNFSETFHDWSNDERYLSIENSDHKIEIWNATSFEYIKEVNVTILNRHIMSFSPDSTELAFLKHNGKSVYIYNLSTGNISHLSNSSITFSDNNFPSNRIQWSADGKKIGVIYSLNSGSSSRIFIWDRLNSSLIKEIEVEMQTITTPILSPDLQKYGYVMLEGADKNKFSTEVLYVYNTLTEVELFSVEVGKNKCDNYYLTLDWSNTSNLIGAGNCDGIIKICDGSNGELIKYLKTPEFTMSPPG